jgi:hypothetical protein
MYYIYNGPTSLKRDGIGAFLKLAQGTSVQMAEAPVGIGSQPVSMWKPVESRALTVLIPHCNTKTPHFANISIDQRVQIGQGIPCARNMDEPDVYSYAMVMGASSSWILQLV